ASSDESVIDFDIPFSIAYVIGAGIEILATIAISRCVSKSVGRLVKEENEMEDMSLEKMIGYV
ncbi:hypothetical protein Tco_1035634, partial [Tanacetum coccineum]